MKTQEELDLFKRYTDIFTGGSNAVLGITSVHLAQQLQGYISPSLDLGWVIRCILDINSNNLFTDYRQKLNTIPDNSIQPEYKHAKFIIDLCSLFILACEGKQLDPEDAAKYILTKDSEFYFGQELSELNKSLLELVCPELNMVH